MHLQTKLLEYLKQGLDTNNSTAIVKKRNYKFIIYISTISIFTTLGFFLYFIVIFCLSCLRSFLRKSLSAIELKQKLVLLEEYDSNFYVCVYRKYPSLILLSRTIPKFGRPFE